jgi:hypothetical protein
MSNTREYVLRLGHAETKVGIPREFRELRSLFGQAVGLVYGDGAKRPLRCSLKSRPKMPCEKGGDGHLVARRHDGVVSAGNSWKSFFQQFRCVGQRSAGL